MSDPKESQPAVREPREIKVNATDKDRRDADEWWNLVKPENRERAAKTVYVQMVAFLRQLRALSSPTPESPREIDQIAHAIVGEMIENLRANVSAPSPGELAVAREQIAKLEKALHRARSEWHEEKKRALEAEAEIARLEAEKAQAFNDGMEAAYRKERRK